MNAPIREFPRYPVQLDCRVLHGGATLPGKSRDLSKSGISCILAEPIELSSIVDLEIALAFGENSYSEPLRLKAVVVWSTRVANGFQIGAKFVNMTPLLDQFVDMFAEYLDT